MAPSKALGKGLSALISDTSVEGVKSGFLPDLPIEYIHPNPYQPRIDISPDKLIELADSIRQNGIIEPLIVTRKQENRYELIAGERRWRAAKLAGLKQVAVVVKEASPQQMLELAIVENVQRQDLNPLEEALAFDQLGKLFNLTHEDIAQKMGMSRPAVANKVRLLSLPEEIKRGLLEGKISEGHARALLGLSSTEGMLAAYKVIVRDNLSVRAVEELVRRLSTGQKRPERRAQRLVDSRTTALETKLQGRFGKSTTLVRSTKGGKITIPFKDDKELDKLMDILAK